MLDESDILKEIKMEIILTDNELIQKINDYECTKLIRIAIWEYSETEIRIVVSFTKDKDFILGNHKVIHVCTERSDGYGDIDAFKKYGQRLTRLIRRRFPNSEIHSDLRYK